MTIGQVNDERESWANKKVARPYGVHSTMNLMHAPQLNYQIQIIIQCLLQCYYYTIKIVVSSMPCVHVRYTFEGGRCYSCTFMQKLTYINFGCQVIALYCSIHAKSTWECTLRHDYSQYYPRVCVGGGTYLCRCVVNQSVGEARHTKWSKATRIYFMFCGNSGILLAAHKQISTQTVRARGIKAQVVHGQLQ